MDKKILEDAMNDLEKMIKYDKILLEIYNSYSDFAMKGVLDDKYRCGLKIIEIYLKLREICKKLDFDIDLSNNMW
ncbi:MAG: hypothetical protein QME46_06735 [Thermoanaerobacteraceae bacterium]|nr:hypothetical protein [Thermoanaerobacteraceae bacterium]